MTTNYTAIINDNLDMFDGFDYPSDMIEMDNGELLTHDEFMARVYEDDNRAEFEDDGPTEEDYALLHRLEKAMQEIADRCGVYGYDEYREVAAFYSDVYKDIFGMRPYGIGLMYH